MLLFQDGKMVKYVQQKRHYISLKIYAKRIILKLEGLNNVGNEVKLKTCNINNRRYLGNKFKLTNFIRNTVMNNCTNIESVFDIFSGTGSVAAAFQDKIVFTND